MATAADIVTLRSHFERRRSLAYRIRASNPDDRTAEDQNSQIIETACEDALDAFGYETGSAVDMTNEPDQIGLLVRMVEVALLEYGAVSGEAIDKKREEMIRRIEAFRAANANARVTPSRARRTYTHSTPDSAGRPPFDDKVFEDKIPNSPYDTSEDS